jgi:hypothetical protein
MQFDLLPKLASASLVAMYGIVPFLLQNFGIYEIHWAALNLLFSVTMALSIIYLPILNGRLGSKLIDLKFSASNKLITFIFLFSLIIFYNFPWHDDRESYGSSISAICRASWLFIIFSVLFRREKVKIIILMLTFILMFIDGSRTYFVVGILALAASSIHRKKILVYGISLAVILASVRMGISDGPLGFILYGVVGESYNATKPVGQVIQLADVGIDIVGHLSHTFLQPFVFPFEFFATRILNFDITSQSDYFSKAVENQLGEILSPMGGWYIVADFVHYGLFGIPLMLIYIYFTWYLSCKIFNNSNFPYGSYIFFISIKSTPYIYWKFVFYIAAVFFVLRFINILFSKKMIICRDFLPVH